MIFCEILRTQFLTLLPSGVVTVTATGVKDGVGLSMWSSNDNESMLHRSKVSLECDRIVGNRPVVKRSRIYLLFVNFLAKI